MDTNNDQRPNETINEESVHGLSALHEWMSECVSVCVCECV